MNTSRLHILSDLHIDHSPVEIEDVGADVEVLAGDIAGGTRGVDLANESACPVVYVPGNHEYYGQRFDDLVGRMRAVAAAHVHVLDDDVCVIDGVRFVGATLWTDFGLFGARRMPSVSTWAAQHMNDYGEIHRDDSGTLLTPADTARAHASSLAFLQRVLAVAHAGPTVVVTRHAPAARSLRWLQRMHPIGAALASDVASVVRASAAAAWIHGHTHSRASYRLGSTPVISNPRGYRHERTGFDPRFVLSVPLRSSRQTD